MYMYMVSIYHLHTHTCVCIPVCMTSILCSIDFVIVFSGKTSEALANIPKRLNFETS